jgi:hypothetical protein
MPKYLFHGSYTPEGYRGLLNEGGSGRREAAKQALSSVALSCTNPDFAKASASQSLNFCERRHRHPLLQLCKVNSGFPSNEVSHKRSVHLWAYLRLPLPFRKSV